MSAPERPLAGANHLFYGDNLRVLRDSIASESVDLIEWSSEVMRGSKAAISIKQQVKRSAEGGTFVQCEMLHCTGRNHACSI